MTNQLAKIIAAVLVHTFFVLSEVQAQPGSQQSLFFPHHINDKWVYHVLNWVGDDTLVVTITSDSTDNLGSAYLDYRMSTRKPNDIPSDNWYKYQKVDGSGNVYIGNGISYPRLQYKGDALLGERWATGYDVDTAFVKAIIDTSIFGMATTVRQLAHKVGTEGYGEWYAGGLGIVARTGSYPLSGQLFLIAAKIGGILYGDTILAGVSELCAQKTAPDFQLLPSYPNPFNGSTTIRYALAQVGQVRLTVYDILGREVQTLVNENQQKGDYYIRFESAHISSGVYFVRLETRGKYNISKLILQR